MYNDRNIFKLHFKSIRTSMICWFSLLILLTLFIFSIISIQYTEETVMGNSIDYTTGLIKQVNRDIDSYINYMENISALVLNGGDVQKYLFETTDKEEERELYNRIITQFNTVLETRQDISNIGVIAGQDRFIVNDGEDELNRNTMLHEVEWYVGATQEKERILTASHVQNVIKNNYKWVVTLCKGIEDSATGRNQGVFFIDLNYRLLKDLCENNSLGAGSYVFIVDEKGKIIYHPRQQLLFSGLKTEKIDEVLQCTDNYFVAEEEKESRLYNVSVSEKTGWRVVGVAYLNELMKDREETQRLYMLTAATLLLAAVIIAVFMAAEITRPIKILNNSMKEVEKGNFEITGVEEWQDNEIGSLGKSFDLMISRIRQLMKENIHEQQQKRNSELKALRSQIKPHFLYNTLDSIIWMAEGGKNREVVLMTSALAKLLRQSISNDNEQIPLEQEVEYARSYLIIQRMRYKDKLEYEIEVEDGIRQEPVINLILQPLVENAIYHGIKYKGSRGMIRIKVYSLEDRINLEVSDNGVGMDEETLADIFNKSRESEGNNGVGVYNVQTRIRLYYGEEYGLYFRSTPGEGTTAAIIIPRASDREDGSGEK